MSKISLAEMLEHDIRNLEDIFDYEKYEISKEQAKLIAQGVIKNLRDHIEELLTQANR